MLTDASGLAPTAGQTSLDVLVPLAYGFAQEVYPELMRPDLNQVPFWMTWLTPKRAYTMSDPGPADRWHGWLAVLLIAYWTIALAATVGAYRLLVWLLEKGFDKPWAISLTVIGFLASLSPLVFLRVPTIFFFPQRRRRSIWPSDSQRFCRCGTVLGQRA